MIEEITGKGFLNRFYERELDMLTNETDRRAYSAHELAYEFDTDLRTVRKFLRSLPKTDARYGGRIALDDFGIEVMRRKYNEFLAQRAQYMIRSLAED